MRQSVTKGAKQILITEIYLIENGEEKIGNLIIDKEDCELIAFHILAEVIRGLMAFSHQLLPETW